MLKHPLTSALLSVHRPLHLHHLSSHQARAITRRLRNNLHLNPRVLPDCTALLSTWQQLQPPNTASK
jgi:hypothetical protein